MTGTGANLGIQHSPLIDRFPGAIAREQTDRFRPTPDHMHEWRSSSGNGQWVRLLLREELPFAGRGVSSHFDPKPSFAEPLASTRLLLREGVLGQSPWRRGTAGRADHVDEGAQRGRDLPLSVI